MSEVTPLAELLGYAFYYFERIKPLLPTYGHLLVAALFPIWIGAHASLSRPSSATKPPKKDTEKDGQDTDDEEADEESGPVQKMEGLEPSDALMFPLTAGLTLGGLYLVIKWLEDPAILNKILSFYFSQMGVFFAIAFVKDALLILRSFIFPRYYRYRGQVWHAEQRRRMFITRATDGSEDAEGTRLSPLPGLLSTIPLPRKMMHIMWTCRNVSYQRLQLRAHIRGVFDVKTLVGLLDLLSGIFALSAVGYFAFVTKPWWLTNFLGFSFSYGALQFMSPSTFWTGSLILGSLFFYDIYFVFFTPLMVTVATKLDVPIKLLFPRPPSPGEAPDAVSLAMLGLGDIVIPGMMIGLALRFDLFLYYHRKTIQIATICGSNAESDKAEYQRATGSWGERFWAPTIIPQEPELKPPYHDARSFPKIYFKASIVGYVVGMVTTLLAMQYSNHAQPALLYLVPGVLTSLWGTAFVRGETSLMWNFSDADEESEEEGEGAASNEKAEGPGKKDENGNVIQKPKSLFMRILSGDLKSLTGVSDSSAQQDAQSSKAHESTKKPTKAVEDERPQASETDSSQRKDADDNRDLILLSISFPLKTRSKAEQGSPQHSNTEKNGMATIPKIEELDEEPPLKKRRGTPRKPVTQ
ncbi:hypothetical protein N7462_001113 [Penicillium macrosclerotiorum]|uniref:uncharacterized protein n=1 Tax=Penicillium macrosclerotiorum TaxID=303699 RepID=UPI0025495BE2|nr:uncharacterized protein N7462_001113 [Penicillium macrosclerotiorum]KAJ5699108.1 hypothetical protein N7462_001113 [Penicillium macrosclerotiorum]